MFGRVSRLWRSYTTKHLKGDRVPGNTIRKTLLKLVLDETNTNTNFFARTMIDWNSSPNDGIDKQTIESFKKAVMSKLD